MSGAAGAFAPEREVTYELPPEHVAELLLALREQPLGPGLTAVSWRERPALQFYCEQPRDRPGITRFSVVGSEGRPHCHWSTKLWVGADGKEYKLERTSRRRTLDTRALEALARRRTTSVLGKLSTRIGFATADEEVRVRVAVDRLAPIDVAAWAPRADAATVHVEFEDRRGWDPWSFAAGPYFEPFRQLVRECERGKRQIGQLPEPVLLAPEVEAVQALLVAVQASLATLADRQSPGERRRGSGS